MNDTSPHYETYECVFLAGNLGVQKKKSNWETRSPAQNQGMDLETQSTAETTLLMMVLQDRVSGGQAHPGSLHGSCYPQAIPSRQAPPPVPHWLNTVEQTIFLGVTSVYFLSLYGLAPHWHLVSSFPPHLFPFLCFEFTNGMSQHENPRHPALSLFAWTF